MYILHPHCSFKAIGTACMALLLFLPTFSSAQSSREYPARPIEMIVNFGPGGSADQAGRTVARFLPQYLGVPIPTVNVTGASGNTGLARVASGRPDGYTMGTFTGIAITTMATGTSRLKMDQFQFLAIADASTSMFFVSKLSPFSDFQGMLDYAKQNPGKIRVATAGLGTQDDIVIQALTKAGYPIRNVPMDPGERHSAPLGGHVEVLFQQIDSVLSLVQSGDLKPIVVFDDERHSEFPDVPTSREFGFELTIPNWRGLVVPAGTPQNIVETLHNAILKVLKSEEYRAICTREYKCVDPMGLDETRNYVTRYYEEITALMNELGLAQ